MKTLLKIIGVLIVLGIAAAVAIAFAPTHGTPPQQQVAADFKPAAGQGEYAMRLGDCAACHTVEGGKPFAGGRPIASPFGTIWSSNITPDPETGIGNYTLDDFRAALYDGIRKDGAHLYPAMPYDNFRKMSEEDVRALYSYFMKEVEPVSGHAPKTRLAFPFDQRWGIRVWNWAALSGPGFQPRYNDPVLDRGAYIVEGPGHCGACHTPRNLVFSQEGVDAEKTTFLAGGEIGGWSAPSLHGPKSAPRVWSAADLTSYLASGRNTHAAVAGEMTLVIEDSLQYMTDQDLDAVVAYLRHINGATDNPPPATNDEDNSKTVALLSSADPSIGLGPRLYLDNCNACHFVNGKGAADIFPSLDGNSIVTADQTAGLIDVILHGARMPSTKTHPARLAMPGFGERLSNGEVAVLATFLRSAWSNTAGPVSSETVAKKRGQAKDAVQ